MRLVLYLLFLLLLVACISQSVVTKEDNFTVILNSDTMRPNDTLTLGFTAKINDQFLTASSFFWFSGDTSVVTVQQNTVISKFKKGYAKITARYRSDDTKEVEASVYVSEDFKQIDSIKALKDTLKLVIGDTNAIPIQVAYRGIPDTSIRWKSFDINLVNFLDNSVICQKIGSGQIQGTSNFDSTKKLILYVSCKTISFSINSNNLLSKLKLGDSILFNTEIELFDNHNLSAGQQVKWSSNPPNLVDEEGLFKGSQVGVVSIFASLIDDGLYKDSFSLIVFPPISGLNIHNSSPKQIKNNISDLLSVSVALEGDYQGYDSVVWYSDNNDIVSINSEGSLLGNQLGFAYIKAISFYDNSIQDSIQIEVIENLSYVESISVYPFLLEMYQGDTSELQVIVQGVGEFDSSFNIFSSSSRIVGIQGEKVIAKDIGSIDLTVSSSSNISIITRIPVIVLPARVPVTGIAINNKPPSAFFEKNTYDASIHLFKDYNIAVNVFPENATNKQYKFYSEPSGLVDPSGLVSFTQGGAVKVFVMSIDNVFKDSLVFTVVDPNAKVFAFRMPSNYFLPVNKDSLDMHYDFVSTGGAKITPRITFTDVKSGELAYATVRGEDQFVTIYLAKDTVGGSIKSKAEIGDILDIVISDAGFTIKRHIYVFIIDSVVPATAIHITAPSNSQVFQGDSLQIVSGISPINHTDTLKWRSYPDGLVDSNGKIVFDSVGDITVWAMLNETAKDSLLFKVTPSILVDIPIDTIRISVGDSVEIPANVQLFKNTISNQLIWFSSQDIVVVDNSQVKAVDMGLAMVTAKLSDNTKFRDSVYIEIVETNFIPMTSFSITDKSTIIRQSRFVGDRTQLFTNSVPNNATNRTVKWFSKPEGLIDSLGKINFLFPGDIKVTAVSSSTLKDEVVFKVLEEVKYIRITTTGNNLNFDRYFHELLLFDHNNNQVIGEVIDLNHMASNFSGDRSVLWDVDTTLSDSVLYRYLFDNDMSTFINVVSQGQYERRYQFLNGSANLLTRSLNSEDRDPRGITVRLPNRVVLSKVMVAFFNNPNYIFEDVTISIAGSDFIFKEAFKGNSTYYENIGNAVLFEF